MAFKIKSFYTWLISTAGFFLIFFLIQCGNPSSKSNTDSSQEASQAVRDGVVRDLKKAKLNKNIYPKAPLQMRAVHDITLIPIYLQESNKSFTALVLGIYMSDLGYVNGFGESALAERYFEGCFVMASEIGMKKQFDRAIDFQFSDILSENEKLSPQQEKILSGAVNSVDSAEFKKLHAAALAGFFLEELYHMVVFLESTSASDSLREQTFQILVHQKLPLNTLVRYFDHLPMKPEGITLYSDFLKLQEKYLSIDLAQFSTQNFPSILQDKHYADIISSIKDIRAKIVARRT